MTMMKESTPLCWVLYCCPASMSFFCLRFLHGPPFLLLFLQRGTYPQSGHLPEDEVFFTVFTTSRLLDVHLSLNPRAHSFPTCMFCLSSKSKSNMKCAFCCLPLPCTLCMLICEGMKYGKEKWFLLFPVLTGAYRILTPSNADIK